MRMIVTERPASLTDERWAEIKEEIDTLQYSYGWGFLRGQELSREESDYVWTYIYEVEGLDSCSVCGQYVMANELDWGTCESCAEDEDEDELEDD